MPRHDRTLAVTSEARSLFPGLVSIQPAQLGLVSLRMAMAPHSLKKFVQRLLRRSLVFASFLTKTGYQRRWPWSWGLTQMQIKLRR
jgi:hypothetical protein